VRDAHGFVYATLGFDTTVNAVDFSLNANTDSHFTMSGSTVQAFVNPGVNGSTITGGTVSRNALPSGKKYIIMDGVTTQLAISGPAFNQPFTLWMFGFWAVAPPATGFSYPLSAVNATLANRGVMVLLQNAQIRGLHWNTNQTTYTPLETNKWYLITMVSYGTNNTDLYIDGTRVHYTDWYPDGSVTQITLNNYSTNTTSGFNSNMRVGAMGLTRQALSQSALVTMKTNLVTEFGDIITPFSLNANTDSHFTMSGSTVQAFVNPGVTGSTIVGGTVSRNTLPSGKKYIIMDGVTTQLAVSGPAFNQPFTLWMFGFWAVAPVAGEYPYVFSAVNPDLVNRGLLVRSTSTVIVNGTSVLTYAPLEISKWYHIALVSLGTNQTSVYIDGVLVSTGPWYPDGSVFQITLNNYSMNTSSANGFNSNMRVGAMGLTREALSQSALVTLKTNLVTEFGAITGGALAYGNNLNYAYATNVISNTGSWTWQMWVNIPNSSGYAIGGHFAGIEWHDAGDTRFYLEPGPLQDNLGYQLSVASNQRIVGNGPKRLTITRSGTSFQVFINGTLIGGTAVSEYIFGSNFRLTVGFFNSTNVYASNARMWDVTVWDTVRTSTQILANDLTSALHHYSLNGNLQDSIGTLHLSAAGTVSYIGQ
jgi:hypothetical protein